MSSKHSYVGLRPALYRAVLDVIRTKVEPAVTDVAARDALESIERLLSIQIVADEAGSELWRAFGPELSALAQKPFSKDGGFDQLEALRQQLAERARADAVDAPALMAVEHRLQRAFAERRLGVCPAGPQGPLDAPLISREAVEAYLRRRLSASPDLRVVGLDELPGGRVKATYRVALEHSGELPPVVLLRLDKPKSLLPTRTADEWPLLQALHRHGGVASPEPYLVEADPTPLGGSFIIMQWANGVKAGEIFPEVAAPVSGRRGIVLHMAQILARLHTMPAEASGLPAMTSQATVDATRARTVETYERLRTTAPVAEFEFGYRWILEHLADGHGPTCVVHGDVGLHNMLVDGERVTALVDWELAHQGSPAEDMARMRPLVEFLTPGGWEAFTTAYEDAGGPPEAFERRRLDFYSMVATWSAVSASLTCRELYFEAGLKDFVYANAGVDFVLRTRLMLMAAIAAIDLEGPR